MWQLLTRTLQRISGKRKQCAIVKAMVEQRNAMGLSQRELAARCGIPQSSVARIESFKTMPNLDTLLKIFQQLGLKLTISAA